MEADRTRMARLVMIKGALASSPQSNAPLDSLSPFEMSLAKPHRAEPVVSRLGHSLRRVCPPRTRRIFAHSAKGTCNFMPTSIFSQNVRDASIAPQPAKQKRHCRRPSHKNHHALSVTGRLAGPLDLLLDDRSLQQPERATEASAF